MYFQKDSSLGVVWASNMFSARFANAPNTNSAKDSSKVLTLVDFYSSSAQTNRMILVINTNTRNIESALKYIPELSTGLE